MTEGFFSTGSFVNSGVNFTDKFSFPSRFFRMILWDISLICESKIRIAVIYNSTVFWVRYTRNKRGISYSFFLCLYDGQMFWRSRHSARHNRSKAVYDSRLFFFTVCLTNVPLCIPVGYFTCSCRQSHWDWSLEKKKNTDKTTPHPLSLLEIELVHYCPLERERRTRYTKQTQ